MTAAEIAQMRRNVTVLDHLTESFEAHRRGDLDARDRAISAAAQCDAQVYIVISGAMVIGEVPDPETDWPGWTAYVAAQREALARAEDGVSP